MDRIAAERLVHDYYDAFNSGDRARFLALLDDAVIHDISQGGSETGKPAFARFMEHMDRCYRERIELRVVLSDESGAHAAAEFTVYGTYVATDQAVPEGTPAASGQTYTLPAGAFFTLRGDRVARISNHYNLDEWVRQIGSASHGPIDG